MLAQNLPLALGLQLPDGSALRPLLGRARPQNFRRDRASGLLALRVPERLSLAQSRPLALPSAKPNRANRYTSESRLRRAAVLSSKSDLLRANASSILSARVPVLAQAAPPKPKPFRRQSSANRAK